MSNKRKAAPIAPAAPAEPSTNDVAWSAACAAATKFIQDNWNKNPQLEDIAKAAAYSAFHLHRIYHKVTGRTTKQFVTQLQVENAKKMIMAGNGMADVASGCGFAHQSHFTMRFKQVVGTTPVRWRRQQQRDAQQTAAA